MRGRLKLLRDESVAPAKGFVPSVVQGSFVGGPLSGRTINPPTGHPLMPSSPRKANPVKQSSLQATSAKKTQCDKNVKFSVSRYIKRPNLLDYP